LLACQPQQLALHRDGRPRIADTSVGTGLLPPLGLVLRWQWRALDLN
jgi:hypothetical protein